MKRAAVFSLAIGVAALFTAGPAVFTPGWILFWIPVPAASILAGRWARRWHGPGDSRGWVWLASSGGSLAWLSLILAVPGLLALPSLIRSRVSHNATQTEAEIRELLAAEERYRASTGSYGSLHCLAIPSECVSGTPPPPTRAGLASLRPRFGFERHFYPGAARGGGLESFAYLAVPLVTTADGDAFRMPTGDYALCGDSTGRVCRVPEQPMRALRGGRCPGPAPAAPEARRWSLPLCDPGPPVR